MDLFPPCPLKKLTTLLTKTTGGVHVSPGGRGFKVIFWLLHLHILPNSWTLKSHDGPYPLPRSRSITNVLRYVNVPYYTCNWKQKRENRLIHTQLSSIDILSILVIGHFNEDKRLFCYYRSRFYYTNKKCSYTLRNPTVSFRNENFGGVILIR